ncbi:MAG: NUDIX domain-containing protein [Chitinophagaceae bacterium]
MTKYQKQTRLLLAVDCIIFGFDGQAIKLLLIQRGFEPEKGKWSLMGGFIQPDESAEAAATRILKSLTGLEGVYLEELNVFSEPKRDPIERTVSIAYFALIDIHQYEKQLTDEYHPEWVLLNKIPKLVFDHDKMVLLAREKLKYKAIFHPILFELLPNKFTLPQLLNLYQEIFNTSFDKRNFIRKLLSTELLIRQKDKEKGNSKKGAFYYKLNKRKYKANFHEILSIIPGTVILNK